MTHLFEHLMLPLLKMSLTAAFVAVVVILLRLVLKKRAPKQVVCLLWLLVFARLLIPVMAESPVSLIPSGDFSAAAGMADQPDISPSGFISSNDAQPGQSAVGTVPSTETDPAASQPVPSTPRDPDPEAPAVDRPVTEEPDSTPVWMRIVPAVWLAGVTVMLAAGIGSYAKLRRRVYDAIRTADGVWEHPSLASPFILGLFRPKIYLPMGIEGQPRQFILQHERAHLRRLDHVVKPICWLALAIHWFNPLAWAAFLLMSRDIETACDESVIRKLGSGVKADYSATLLALATDKRFPAPSPLSFGEGDAKVRIKNVLSFKKPALWVTIAAVVVVIAAAVCLLTDPVEPEEVDLSGYTTMEEYPGLYFLEEESSTAGDKITAYRLVDGELVLVGGYDEHLANNFFGLIGPDGKEDLLFLGPEKVYAMFEELLAAACLELDPNWTPPGESGENNDPVVDPAPISAPDELLLSALSDRVKIVVPGLGMTDVLSVLVRETAPDVEMRITQMAAVDLDGDGIAEVLLRLETPGTDHGTLILHCNGSDGQVYGYVLWFRAFNSVKTDGTFSYSGGASVNGIARISFTSEGYEQEKITYSEWNHPDPNVYCYVNKQPATEEEFLDAFAAWRETPGVTWTEYTAENAEALISRHFAAGSSAPLALATAENRLAAATKDFYVIREDGTLVMFGSPEGTLIGSGLSNVPVDKPVTLMDTANVVFVDVGIYGGVMAIDTSGTLWGHGTFADPEAPNVPVRLLDSVASVSCGQYDTYILRCDGSLWSFGQNRTGFPTLQTMEVSGVTWYKLMDNVLFVEAGGFGSGHVILSDHTLWSWNQMGEMVKAADNVASYSAGRIIDLNGTLLDGSGNVLLTDAKYANRHYAIKNDGTLWALTTPDPDTLWGVGTPLETPVFITDNVAYLASGEFESIFLKRDRSLWKLSIDGTMTDISFSW